MSEKKKTGEFTAVVLTAFSKLQHNVGRLTSHILKIFPMATARDLQHLVNAIMPKIGSELYGVFVNPGYGSDLGKLRYIQLFPKKTILGRIML